MKTEVWNNGVWTKRARKTYKCHDCKRTIEIGETYWNDYNCADDPFHPDRYCRQCATDFKEVPDYNSWPRENILIALADEPGAPT